MKRFEVRRSLQLFTMAAFACSACLASSPAFAIDKSVAACFAEIGGITAAAESANAAADVAEQAADIGLPVAAPGILAGINQLNANVAATEGPLTSIARSVCDINDTESTSANPLTFAGWTEASDTEPLPTALSTQIDGTALSSSPMAKTADLENEASIKKMEANLTGGYFSSHLDNEAEGLAAIEGMALDGIAAEKIALASSEKNVLKFKASGNIKEMTAIQMEQLNILTNAVVRLLIAVNHQTAVDATYHWNDMAPNTMYRNDHSALAKTLIAPV